MTTVAILGGGGPFGQHLARYLLDHTEAQVICIGRSAERKPVWTLCRHGEERYHYWRFNLVSDLPDVAATLDTYRPDVIVNFAALAAAVWPDNWRYYETNVVGLAMLTERLAGAEWLRHWVQIGSSEVYGSCAHAVLETDAVNPTHPYSVSKAAADMHLLSLARVKGFPVTILRPSNAYGECQQLRRIVPRATLAALTGGKVPLEGGGVARKSYIHAEDLARAIVLAAEAPAKGEIYHIGPKHSTAIRDLVGRVASISGLSFEELVEIVPDRVGQDAEYLLDSSKAERELGWVPEIGLGEGLRRVFTWVNGNLSELRQPEANPPYVLAV